MMMPSKSLNLFCWKFCNAYCGCGDYDEEETKPSALLIDPSGDDWQTDHQDAVEHKERSSKIKEMEECITEQVRQRQERRHRITVFAKQIQNVNSCPPSYPKTEEEHEFLRSVLSEDKEFIFADFSEKERLFMTDIMEKDTSFRKGDMIYRVGDTGECFYIIDQGEVELISGHSHGAISSEIYKRGDSFGGVALVYSVPRRKTARAKTDCVLWRIHQLDFRAKLAHNAVQHEKEMMQLLRQVPLFENMDDDSLRKVSNAFERVNFEENQPIINKGDVGEVFYIIEEGTIRMYGFGMGDSQHVDQTLSSGDWFGERSLLTGEPRTYNATAMTKVTAWAVDKKTFESSFGPIQDVIVQQMRTTVLQTLPIFAKSDILPTELNELANRMVELSLRKEHCLDQFGELYRQQLIIVQEGKIAVYDGNAENSNGKVFTLKAGDYYGDKHISDDPPKKSQYNVVCEENTTCWILSREDLKNVIGDLHRLGRPISYAHKRRVSAYMNGVFLKDLDQVKVLGHGGFGKVWLARHKATGNYYALKTLNKRRVLDKNQAKSVLREKDILASINHPFILGQVASFQDENHLYILMDLVQGGELYSLIVNTKGIGLSVQRAVFYGACVFSALAHFHQRLIVYRDLKPENVMIDKDGYCVVVDLGFAKVVTDKTFTLCGTPEYLAPEIFMTQGHDKACDYWSFGVLLFEMLTSKNPFSVPSGKQVDLFKRIVRVSFDIPPTVDVVAADLIKKLLVRNPAMRLGNLQNGPLGVRDHGWFKEIDWKKLVKKEIEAPWIPVIKDGAAVADSHFDTDSYAAYRDASMGKPLTRSEQSIFKDF